MGVMTPMAAVAAVAAATANSERLLDTATIALHYRACLPTNIDAPNMRPAPNARSVAGTPSFFVNVALAVVAALFLFLRVSVAQTFAFCILCALF